MPATSNESRSVKQPYLSRGLCVLLIGPNDDPASPQYLRTKRVLHSHRTRLLVQLTTDNTITFQCDNQLLFLIFVIYQFLVLNSNFDWMNEIEHSTCFI